MGVASYFIQQDKGKRIVKTLITIYGVYSNIFAEKKCEQLLQVQQKYRWIRYCIY